MQLAKWGTWYGASGVAPTSTTYDYDTFEGYVRAENALLVQLRGDPLAKRPQGQLFPVNFIDPDYLEDVNGEDEHPPGVPRMGQRFVYDVVRVLMENPEVWKRSVLFITYDEGGGFYDHVDPPRACPPDDVPPRWDGFYFDLDAQYGGTFDRYGFRVPLLVVSPWAKRHYVSHATADHTSITRFIEARFGLPALTRRDANADPLLDVFDFTSPRDKLAGNSSNGDASAWGAERLPESFLVGPGQTYVQTFPSPGTYPINCTVNADESIVVTVE